MLRAIRLGALDTLPAACRGWLDANYNLPAFEQVRQAAGRLLARAPLPRNDQPQQAIDFLTEVSQLFADASAALNLPRMLLVAGPARYFRYAAAAVDIEGHRWLPVRPSFGTALFDPLVGAYNPRGVTNLEVMKRWWHAGFRGSGGAEPSQGNYVAVAEAGGLTRLPTWFCGAPFLKTHWTVRGRPFADTVPQAMRDAFARRETIRRDARSRSDLAACLGDGYQTRPWNTCRDYQTMRVPYSTYSPTLDDCFGYAAFGKRWTIWMGPAVSVMYATQLLRALMGETGEQKIARAFNEWRDLLLDIGRQLNEAGELVAGAAAGHTDTDVLDAYNAGTTAVNAAGDASGNFWVKAVGFAMQLFGMFGAEGRGFITGSHTNEWYYPERYVAIPVQEQTDGVRAAVAVCRAPSGGLWAWFPQPEKVRPIGATSSTM